MTLQAPGQSTSPAAPKPATIHTPSYTQFSNLIDEDDFLDEYEILREIEAAEAAEAKTKVLSRHPGVLCMPAMSWTIYRMLI